MPVPNAKAYDVYCALPLTAGAEDCVTVAGIGPSGIRQEVFKVQKLEATF